MTSTQFGFQGPRGLEKGKYVNRFGKPEDWNSVTLFFCSDATNAYNFQE